MKVFTFLTVHILDLPFWVSLAILMFTLVLQLVRRDLLKKHASRIFLYSAGIVFAYLIYVGYLQFIAFQSGPLDFTLGTKSGLSWFFGYVQLHFLNDYVISFLAAILFTLIGGFFNRKYHERFFEREELYLLALGILLVGYPGFFFYIPLVLIASIVISAFLVRRGERLPLYHFWIPTAIAVLFVTHFWANSQPWWVTFRF